MRGRKPKPTRLKILEGTHRKDRARHEPLPPGDVPTCPSFLTATAREEWQRLAPTLHAMGVLTVIDRAAFAGYCQCYGHAVEAEEAIVRDGLFLKGPRGKRYVNPHVAIGRRAWDEMRRFAVEFGMTPSSRARLDVKVPPSGEGTSPERPSPRYRFGRTPPSTA